MPICEICGKELKPLGFAAHKRLAHSPEGHEQVKNMNALWRGSKSSKPAWNKGLTKDTDYRMKRISESLIGREFHESTRKKISENAKTQGFGGYRPTGGRGKKDGIMEYGVIRVGN